MVARGRDKTRSQTKHEEGQPMTHPDGSNRKYELRIDKGAGKTRFTFPTNAAMTRGKCEFKSPEELLKYIETSVGVVSVSNGLRGTIARSGKYQKVDQSGNPVLTI